MEFNAVLEQVRRLVHNYNVRPDPATADLLTGLVEDLDERLSSGGCLPDEWRGVTVIRAEIRDGVGFPSGTGFRTV